MINHQAPRILFIFLLFMSGNLHAQTGGGAAGQLPLDQQQLSISQRYERFEQTLLKIVEITRETDPARADLLLRAIGKSRELRISPQLDSIVQLLQQDRLGEAGTRQDDLVKSLMVVLEILQSEDERSRIKTEMERVQDLLKDLERVVGKQKDVRADTERGGEFDPLGKKQSDVEQLAEDLKKKMEEQDAQANEKSGGKKPPSPSENSGESSQQMKEPGEESEQKTDESDPEKKPGDPEDPNETKAKDPKDSEKKPNESQSPPSEAGDSKESQETPESEPKQSQQKKPPQNQQPAPEQSPQEQSEEQSGEQQEQSESAQQQQKTPGREELEKAKAKMEEAIEELKKKQREKASDKQDEALLELQKAKAKLEELLRQLREEELELMLMALEARFRRMLELQYQVKNGTLKLAEIPEPERISQHSQRAVQLSRDQSAIMLEADNSLVLLKEEGSSVAFPEAVIQLRDDMELVSRRLEKIDVGEITLAIEDDLIEGLKELIESLQKELEKLQNKQQNSEDQQPSEQEDPALVDELAEMKLLRSLQQRINRRTRQYSLQVDGEQAIDRELRELLKDLAARQSRVFKATYDLSSGQNK